MTTKDIAEAFAALMKAGKFKEAGDAYWADDVVSIEAMPGDMALVSGRAAVEAKSEWWMANHEVHNFTTEGPFVNGDQFALLFDVDVTAKVGPMADQRMAMREVGIYTLRDGKIAEERFLY